MKSYVVNTLVKFLNNADRFNFSKEFSTLLFYFIFESFSSKNWPIIFSQHQIRIFEFNAGNRSYKSIGFFSNEHTLSLYFSTVALLKYNNTFSIKMVSFTVYFTYQQRINKLCCSWTIFSQISEKVISPY